MLRVLVTGGFGNLGSWLVDYFLERGYRVSVLAKKYRPIFPLRSVDFIAADISDFAQLKFLKWRKFDAVVHLASCNEGGRASYFSEALKVNTLGTRNLLEALKPNPPRHFIYFSTFHIYGKNGGYIDENTQPAPLNDYGMSHLGAELYLQMMGRTHDIAYSIFRLTNSYGCPLDEESSKWYLLLNDLVRGAYINQKIVLHSNGKPLRDFIWMGNVCRIVDQALYLTPENTCYNLSAEKVYSTLEIARFVQRAYIQFFGKEIPIAVNDEDVQQYPHQLRVSSEKLKQKIPYVDDPMFEEEAFRTWRKYFAKDR